MTVFDAKSLSRIGTPWFNLAHTRTVTHTGTGDQLWAVVALLVRRNERIDPQTSVLYGETLLESEGRVWLNNLPPGEATHSFIEIFSGRVPEGEFDVTATVSSGTRFTGEYRFDVRTYREVERAGAFTSAFGDTNSDDMALTLASASGRHVVVAFAHQSQSPITDFTGTHTNNLDLLWSVSEGVVGDVSGASSVTVSGERTYGRMWCAAALDLVTYVESKAAKFTLTGATPTIDVVTPPPTSPVVVPVLTLAPGINQMNPKHLRQELFRFPYQPIKVTYTNIPGNRNAAGGVTKLDAALHKYVGQRILVVGHSMGGQVIYKWLREMAETSDIDPTEVTFICTGNPERKYNGIPGGGDYPGGPDGTGLPDGAWGYRVIDIARQYDFWADHPDDTENEAAIRNVDPTGSNLGWGSPVHTDYSRVSANPDDPRNFSVTEDTVTYVWSPTYPAPLIDDEDFFTTTATLVPRDDVVREEIEAAYTRPVTIPDPPPSGKLDEQFPWGWDGTQWVRVSKASVEAPVTDWWLEA